MAFDRSVRICIDPEKCIACGECVKVCSHDTISIVAKKAVISGESCLHCDHCRAACANDAISIEGIDDSLNQFATFNASKNWIPFGEYDTGSLITLMQSRRSCRNYKKKAVEKEILEDLVKIGVTAPSGSNCQMWSFTVLSDRASVISLGEESMNFFKRLNGLASKSWLRNMLKLIGKPELSDYYVNNYERIREGIEEWESNGKDMLFHGAPAAILVSNKLEASCPADDALLATQNILLGAHAIGLGTCLIGYVVNAMRRSPEIAANLGIPEDEEVFAIIALGYPKETYAGLSGRRTVPIRYIGS